MFKSQFEKVLDKATSPLNVEPELTSLIQICDYIRSGEVPAKSAVAAIRKRLENTNQHVVQHALVILETCAKNCGNPFHEELATRDFAEFTKDFVRRSKVSEQARNKMLGLVQSLQHGFRQKPEFHIFTETYNELKNSGMQFPAVRDSDAMFDAAIAPAWKDGANCFRCRTTFGTITRKHHCRNCGQVFCNDCTSRYCPIPKYGIEKDVRVCDKCYDELHAAAKKATRNSPERERTSSTSAPSSMASAPKQSHKPSEADLKAEEEFETQLAIALSLSAQEETKKQQERRFVAEYLSQTVDSSSEPAAKQPPTNGNAVGNQQAPAALDTRDMDAELAMYLNRNFWQQRSEQMNSNASAPSAPMATPKASLAGSIDFPMGGTRSQVPLTTAPGANAEQPEDATGPVDGTIDELSSPVPSKKCSEEEQFIDAMKKTVSIFTNRVRSNRASVRNVADDTSVQSLFTTLNRMLPELKALKDKYAARKAYYESLQDKLNEIREGRQVLVAMRSEAAERRRRAEEEAARQKQLDMLAKLEQFRAYKQQMLANTLRIMEEQQRYGSLYGPPVSGPAQAGNPGYMPPMVTSQSQYAYPPGQSQQAVTTGGQPGMAYGYAGQSQIPATYTFANAANPPAYNAGWHAGAPPAATYDYGHQALPVSAENAGYQQPPPTVSHTAYSQPNAVSQSGYQQPSQPPYPTTAAHSGYGGPPGYGYQQPQQPQQQPEQPSYAVPPQSASAGYNVGYQNQQVPQPPDVARSEEQLISFD